MTDLSREELRAHLSAVEAQVRAALRIVAAESKSVQQAHSALRADLSAALIRLQSEMNSGHSKVDGKVDRVISEVNNLARQRKLITVMLCSVLVVVGIFIGVLAGGLIKQVLDGNVATIELPISQDKPASSTTTIAPIDEGAKQGEKKSGVISAE